MLIILENVTSRDSIQNIFPTEFSIFQVLHKKTHKMLSWNNKWCYISQKRDALSVNPT